MFFHRHLPRSSLRPRGIQDNKGSKGHSLLHLGRLGLDLAPKQASHNKSNRSSSILVNKSIRDEAHILKYYTHSSKVCRCVAVTSFLTGCIRASKVFPK